MPKTNIYPRPNSDGTDADRRIEVGWSPDQFAQIGVSVRNPVKVDGLPEGATITSAWAVPGGEIDCDGWTWESQWVDLDRHSINQLIRALREARDKAYGRDE